MRLNNFKLILTEEKVKNKLDFLDGFRGTLCLWVLANHTNNKIYGPAAYPFEQTAHYIGVNGFFILSSFLLTKLVKSSEFFSELAVSPLFIIKARLNFKGSLKSKLLTLKPPDRLYRPPLRVNLLIHGRYYIIS